MDKDEATAGPIARRAFAWLRRLPPAIQEEVFLAIQNFAVAVLLFVAFPVLIAVFIVVTITYALLNLALGAPTGILGAALAYGWLAAIVTLSVVITVRMWRAIPVLIRLKNLAIEGPDRDYESLAPAVPSNTIAPVSIEERVAIADASLEPGNDDASRPVRPPP
jgi:hypothetical protein